jgi:hypothetical protein
VVAGYPTGVVPVPAGAVVRSTSVTGPGRRMQATLVASWPGSRDSLVRYYRRTLRSSGLSGAPGVAAGDSRAVVFSDGLDAVTLTTREARSSPVRFSVVAVLRTGA